MSAELDERNLISKQMLGDLLVEYAPVLVWISNDIKECIFFNKAWLQFTGRSLEQECGFGWTEGVHPDDLPNCVQIYQEAFDARQAFSMDYRLLRHDGQYRWIRDDGAPYFDREQRFKGFFGSCFDISEAKELLKEKDESRKLLMAASSMAQMGHWQLDVKSQQITWSDEIYKLHGVSKDEYQPDIRTAIEFFHEEDRGKVQHYVSDAIEKGEGWLFQLRIVRPSGELRYVLSNGEIQKNEKGQAEKIFGIFQDRCAANGRKRRLAG